MSHRGGGCGGTEKLPDVTGLVAAMLSCQVLRMHVNSLTGSALT